MAIKYGSPLSFVLAALFASVGSVTIAAGAATGVSDSPAQTETTASSASADIATIKARLIARYIGGKFADASRFLASQSPDGSWADINYSDRSLLWDPKKHLDRLKEMAIGYQNGRSPDHRSAPMLQGIKIGLEYWYGRKPQADNWWFNQISQQLALEPILVLMESDLPAGLIETGSVYLLDPKSTIASTQKATGQNLVWLAQEQLVRGVLRNSEQDISSAVDALESTAAITTAEGIQPDYSFHQHGPQLYVGGYGLGALMDGTSSARLVDGTRFAYPKDKIDILADYLFRGSRYMVRGKMLDFGAIGREIARPGGGTEALGLISACDELVPIRPAAKPDCDALKAHIQGSGEPYSFIGHKHFWNSDFTVHQRPAYYASVKLASRRTYGTESINGENLEGYWIPFGVNYIARRGDEYLDIFPVWDWAHLPGVTSPEEVPPIPGHVSQPGSFAGGVSDGMYGASAMKLDIDSGISIHATKAWFFFDRELVALGAGISSSAHASVTTTLAQSLLRGDVVVDGSTVPPDRRAMGDTSWVLHDGIGYVLPGKSPVVLRTGPRSGSWSRINALGERAPMTKDVFALWLDHGVAPADATYEYIVVPGTDAEQLLQYVGHNPIRVLANTATVQAVRHERGISQAVFYSTGQLVLKDGWVMSVDQPCLVLLTEGSDRLTLALSSPYGPLQVHVSLTLPSGTQVMAFELPGGQDTGTTQVQTVTLQ
jgi:chondroitin AC lyase